MYYLHGQIHALQKLGMVDTVGPVAYKPAQTRGVDLGNANTKQEFWKNFDSEPFVTGEESSLGMPSAPKTGSLRKLGTENDYGYGQSPGLTPIGGYDADQERVDRNKRLSDAMQNAFAANEAYDQSYAPESASTQPHGPKMAAAFAAAKPVAAPKAGGYAMRMGSVPRLGTNPGRSTQGMTFNPPQPGAFKAPTSQSPAVRLQRAGQEEARATVSTAHPAAVSATGSSRMATTPTLPNGGAPVNPVPAMPNLTISAPAASNKMP